MVKSCYKEDTCNTFGLPLTYIAYHLNGKTINMDGRLDDEAWAEVPWTQTFVGILTHTCFFFQDCNQYLLFVLKYDKQ